MRKILFYVSLLALFGLSFGQELFIQNSGELKGSERVSGQEYTTVYDNVNHTYRYFDELGNEIFLIKSFDENGDQIGLSIEKNIETKDMEIIIDNIPVALLINSIIYDFSMKEIGRFYRGERSEKSINTFWGGLDYQHGNISIYDHTGIYKVGSFLFKQEVDYYTVLGIDRVKDIDKMDARSIKKHVRTIQRYYKKRVREFDLKNNPDDKLLHEEFSEFNRAYDKVLEDFGVGKKEKKFLGIIPESYFSEEKRKNWSQDEGYVPYTKRVLEGHRPDTKVETDELYLDPED